MGALSKVAVETSLVSAWGPVVAAGLLILWLIKDTLMRRRCASIPGPTGFPLIGHVPYLTKEPWFRFCRFAAQYGPVYKLWVWNKMFVVISDPELVKQVFNPQKGQVYYQKDQWSYDFFRPVLGWGLVTSEGDIWKRHRTLLMPAFHHEALRRLQRVFEGAGVRLCDAIDAACKSALAKRPAGVAHAAAANILSEGNGTSTLDLSPVFRQVTLEVICEVALGLNPTQAHVFPHLFEVILDELNARTFAPWRQFMPHVEKKLQADLAAFNKIVNDIIAERRAIRRARVGDAEAAAAAATAAAAVQAATHLNLVGGDDGTGNNGEGSGVSVSGKPIFAGGGDMLDMMLDSGIELSDEVVADEVKTQLLAGHETSSMMLTWTVYLLCKHPEVLAKVQAEVDSVLGLAPGVTTSTVAGAVTKGEPSYEDFKGLTYLECCLNEAMRVYTPVPVLNRESTEDDNLGGYNIPKGTAVIVSVAALHSSPEIWGADVKSFRPERFLKEETAKRKPFSFIPFSAGPRNCIGQHLALIEAKMILGHMLRRFSFSMHPGTTDTPTADLFVIPVRPVENLRVVATPRK